jgi:universal stress protein A
MNLRRIVAPVDFSACSRRALEWAIDFAEAFGAKVEALHVITPPPYLPLDLAIVGDMLEEHQAQVARGMETLVKELSAGRSVAVSVRIETGIPVDVIALVAENADLLVMGTHGRTGLSHLILGSVAERALRVADCPVITVPPRAGEA